MVLVQHLVLLVRSETTMKVSIHGIQIQANLSTTVDGLQSQLQFLLLGQDTSFGIGAEGASNFTRDMILAL